MYFMLQITINASVRPVFYSGRYATGNIPTNHPCLSSNLLWLFTIWRVASLFQTGFPSSYGGFMHKELTLALI
jgi:hypothetical protein